MKQILTKLKQVSFESWIVLLFILFYGLGAAGLDRTHSLDLFITILPYSLLGVTALLFLVHRNWSLKQIMVFLSVAIIGYGIEVAGVITGHVFGKYSYGSTLGFKVFQTPLLIGLNWLMLIYCVYLITKKTALPVILQVIAGSMLMVFYDIIMEPVAIHLDMWSWKGNDVPLQNYLAWFVISAVMLTIFQLAKLKYQNVLASKLFFIQICFFIALNLILFW